MSDSVGPIRRAPGPRGAKGRRATDGAAAPQAAAPASGASAVDPVGGSADSVQVISAHILGQGPADSAAPAKSAQSAQKAYLQVEWSGGADRRTRRGRIAKTDV